MNKINFFIDVDGVTIDTLQAMSSYKNDRSIFIKIVKEDIKTWNAKEAGFTKDDIEFMFDNDDFWDYVNPYSGIVDLFKDVNSLNKFNMMYCSIGSSNNISNKTRYLKELTPFITNHLMLVKNSDLSPNKSVVNMNGGILIDDNIKNLESSNAKYKLLVMFDGKKEWNQDNNGIFSEVRNIDELRSELLAIAKLEGLI